MDNLYHIKLIRNMKDKIFTEWYTVHLEALGTNTINYTVYQTIGSGENLLYRDAEDDNYVKWGEECHVKMEGSLCWRGVWEDRYYMVDEEYWYGELKELSDLYSNVIEPYLKEQIRLTESTCNG